MEGVALDMSHSAELFSLEARMLPFDSSLSQSLVAPGLGCSEAWGQHVSS